MAASHDDGAEPEETHRGDSAEDPSADRLEAIERHLPNRPLEPHEVAAILIETVETHEGPLPPPQQLREYASILPGLDQVIVDRANREQALRHDVIRANIDNERFALEQQIRLTERGMNFSFALAAVVIVGSLILLGIGRSVEGLTSLLAALASLVGVFIFGRRTARRGE